MLLRSLAPWLWARSPPFRMYGLAHGHFSKHKRATFLDGRYQRLNRGPPFRPFVLCSRQLLNVLACMLKGPELAAIRKSDRHMEAE
jgi:hypothetical protein